MISVVNNAFRFAGNTSMPSCDSQHFQPRPSIASEIGSHQIWQHVPDFSHAQFCWPHVNCCPSFLFCSDSRGTRCSPLLPLVQLQSFRRCTFRRCSSTSYLSFSSQTSTAIMIWPQRSTRFFLKKRKKKPKQCDLLNTSSFPFSEFPVDVQFVKQAPSAI